MMEQTRKKWIPLVLLGCLGLFGTYKAVTSLAHCSSCAAFNPFPGDSSATLSASANPHITADMPQWELTTLEGATLSNETLRGRVVVVNFWATWCGPCIEEMPDLIEIQSAYRAQGVQFVGISLDEGPVEQVKTAARQMDINFPVGVGDLELYERMGGMGSIPFTVVFDGGGTKKKMYVGMVNPDSLKTVLDEVLSTDSPNALAAL